MKKKTAFSQIAHTNKYEDRSPAWESVKNNLPPEAFAVVGNKDDAKTWLYPHHYVLSGSKPTNEGYPTQGDLILHREQFYAQAKQADKDGNKLAVEHFEAHFRAVDPDKDGSFLTNKVGIMAYSEKCVSKHAFDVPVMSFSTDAIAEDGSVPLTLVALSGEILDRPEWGPCVQDLAGMMHAERIVVDYKHDDGQLLGYIDKFDTSSGKLVLQGKMIPQQTHRRVEEITANRIAGMPYEASIYFPPSTPEDMDIEFIEGGKTAMVNGKSVTASEKGLTIFRRWVLRGVACCPHGADRQTAAYLQGADVESKISVSIKQQKEQQMTDAEKAKLQADADAKAKQEASEPAEEPAAEGDGKDAGHEDESEDKKLLKKMVGKFGAEFALKEFLAGSSYESAADKFIDEAKAKMAAGDEDEEEVVEEKEEQAEEQKCEQSATEQKPKAKPAKFAQSKPAQEPTIDGVPAKFAQRVHDDAMKYGWTADRVKSMLEIAKKEFKRQSDWNNEAVTE